MSTGARLRRRPATVAFVIWTFFVWTTRISNIWRDDGLTTGEKWSATAVAVSFTVLAIAVVVTFLRRSGPRATLAVDALAAWTTGVWVVRAIGITFGDRSVGFKVVHVVLAAVSIGLAYLACREVRRPRDVEPATPGATTPAPAAGEAGTVTP